MRSILIHAENGSAGKSRVETGLSLARMTDGHVTLLVDTPTAHYTAVDAMGGAMVATDALQEAIASDDAFAREMDKRLAGQDVTCTVLRAETEPVAALTRAGRLADVVIIARSDPMAGDLPLASRCAVLAVNDDKLLTFPLRSVGIAWDGSAEAAAAMRAAVPLLAGCGEVVVITVEDVPTEWPATDAVEYLSRHGVRAELQVLPRIGSVEDTLSRELQLRGCEVLVMGAFGHSRIREFLFGGVTRSFLGNADGPALLLAH